VVSTVLETALRHDRWLTAGALLLAVLLSWSWIVPMALDMYGEMTGSSAWMMTTRWDAQHVALLFAMWAVMMVGMMLPSAAPTLLLYAAVARKSDVEGSIAPRVYAFGAGYLAIWTLFSLLATALQRLLAATLVLSPMMEVQSRAWAGGLLVLAGVYQFTALKRTCLASCRSPVAFITRAWKPGAGGAFRMGVEHGLYCLGCCWALMLLLFVGGVMNLWVIAAITVFVLLEKAGPLGAQGGRLSGALLVVFGIWVLFR
jgi:predicted metal-binding membrane protein